MVLRSANILLLSAGGDGRFEVDRKNGQVRTTGLPLQRDREYLLTVVAADRLGSRSAPVVVSVVAGARPPQFTNASFTIAIPENTPEGQSWVYTYSTHTGMQNLKSLELPSQYLCWLCSTKSRMFFLNFSTRHPHEGVYTPHRFTHSLHTYISSRHCLATTDMIDSHSDLFKMVYMLKSWIHHRHLMCTHHFSHTHIIHVLQTAT